VITPAISVESLQIAHGRSTIIRIPHFAVAEGEVLTVIGPNGAGKSTLLQVLGLLREPSDGRVFFKGEPVTRASDRVALRRRMALVFQEPLLFRGSVYDNVALGLRFRGVPNREIAARTDWWLRKLKLTRLVRQPVTQLSVGEAQRVNLARSLVLDPEVFLLDEPFASLDPPTQAEMVAELQSILSETTTTTVLVTHNRNEALMLGDRLAVMMNGQIVQTGTPQTVFSHPATEQTAEFLSVETLLSGTVSSVGHGFSRVALACGEILIGGTYGVEDELLICLRPEDISILSPHSRVDSASRRNVLSGTITAVTPLETQVKVVVDCGSPVAVLVSKQVFMDLSPVRGMPVLVTFLPEVVHAIRKNSG